MQRPRGRPRKDAVEPVTNPDLHRMIVTHAFVRLGGMKVARIGDEITVSTQQRASLIFTGGARDA